MGKSDGAGIFQHRQVFWEEVRNAIRDAIFSGDLMPGDRIIETFWAKELGVSQGPVREAIRDLEALGLVETIPFKGSRVRTMTQKDIQDNYSVRICLESKSIRDAVRELDDAQLTALADKIQPALEQMNECAGRGDLRSFTEWDTVYHLCIIEATGNNVLRKLWEQCNIRNWFLISALTDVESLKQLQSDHQNIIEAIRARDAETAASILENHITSLMKSFIRGDGQPERAESASSGK